MSDKSAASRPISPWYWGYALQGLVVLGAMPILLPLIAGTVSAAAAGTVVAAFYAGQLTAPMWGTVAERSGRFGTYFLIGFVLLFLGLIVFPLPTPGLLLAEVPDPALRAEAQHWLTALFPAPRSVIFWSVLAFVQGAGAGASNTVGGMIIVETTPKESWDDRIGWLQTFYGTGQTLGLALASALQVAPAVGVLVCAVLLLPGWVLGRRGLPPRRAPATPSAHKHHHRHLLPHVPHFHLARLAPALGHYHPGVLKSLGRLHKVVFNRFGLFLLSWFLVMAGSWLVYNLYPLLMRESYATRPLLSSLYFAAGAAIGAFLYAPSGTWARRFGNGRVLMLGNLMSLLSLTGMAALLLAPEPIRFYGAPVAYVLLPMAWSPLIVAGTAITGTLAPMPEGEAMGLFNAATALASVLGALGAGAVATLVGYDAIIIIGAALVGVATLAGVGVLNVGLPGADKGA